MRPRSLLCSSVLTLLLALPSGPNAVCQAGAAASPANAAGAAPATNTYRNPELHLSYMYPAGFSDASAVVGPAMQATLSQAPGVSPDTTRCVSLPFSAINTSGGTALVLLVRMDAACLKKTLKPSDLAELTQGVVRGLTASGAHTQFGEPVAFTTQGRAAEMVRGSFTLPTGQPLHSLVSCVLLKPDAACWQFLASSDGKLNEMSGWPVGFDEGTPQPLVPAGLLPKP